ncbi:hypothetical protein GCM10007881_17720 [Mesorhizobium huakuii]|uniref:DUF3830 family protein n=1 Tax=Mesorhizobium huakuii TaxID=28104 RepID=A0ABZ0VLJ2_9HYPH|nr:hypothetical protein [Mesorhizobium huakuii]WQB98327.1 hypothetical protein U0R22_002475 [Mesorhizobium huakuii]GLQ78256.1 hypothetical protein GCM10007881_17720 [Mesorhizobium huakuii]
MRIIFRCDPMLIEHLPRPIPARGALPEWLRAMPATAYSAIHGRDIRTLKQCPPVVDAMTYGFMVLLPCDVVVDKGTFSWDWQIPEPVTQNHPRAPLSFHTPGQLAGSPFATPGQAALKFNSFWTIELEDGWSLFATHPVNREDLPFRLVTGLVDSDRFSDGGINFPAVWTEPGFSGVLGKGTPVAQCFAVPRAAQQLEYEVFDEERQASYARTVASVLSTPGVYRKRFRARRGRSAGE